jgi:hypothetical protein
VLTPGGNLVGASVSSKTHFAAEQQTEKKEQTSYSLEVKDCQVKLEDENLPYGAVNYGYLRVYGRKVATKMKAIVYKEAQIGLTRVNGQFDNEEIEIKPYVTILPTPLKSPSCPSGMIQLCLQG